MLTSTIYWYNGFDWCSITRCQHILVLGQFVVKFTNQLCYLIHIKSSVATTPTTNRNRSTCISTNPNLYSSFFKFCNVILDVDYLFNNCAFLICCHKHYHQNYYTYTYTNQTILILGLFLILILALIAFCVLAIEPPWISVPREFDHATAYACATVSR